MKRSILYQKVIVLTLTTVFLIFGVHGIGYNQFPSEPIVETEVLDIPIEVRIVPDLSVNQIYEKADPLGGMDRRSRR